MSKGPAKPLVLVVACALIDQEGRVLISQRPEGKSLAGLWECPGGKLEDGETPEHALVRELHEELGISVEPINLIPLTFSSFSYHDFHLLMPIYGCKCWLGELSAKEGQGLAWAAPAALSHYPMPPADEPVQRIMPELVRCWREGKDGD